MKTLFHIVILNFPQAAGVLLAGNVSLSKLPNLFDSGTKVKVVTYFDIFLPYSSLKILKDALTQVGNIGDDIDNVRMASPPLLQLWIWKKVTDDTHIHTIPYGRRRS